LVSIGVLEEVDGNPAGPWCSPSFIIPKKDGTVRFITDCREVNRRIVRKPWPMPHIADLLQDIGRHSYASALDLSMGCYHFKLDKKLQDVSTFVLPWGLCKCLRLPMGLSIGPDLFQAHVQMLLLAVHSSASSLCVTAHHRLVRQQTVAPVAGAVPACLILVTSFFFFQHGEITQCSSAQQWQKAMVEGCRFESQK